MEVFAEIDTVRLMMNSLERDLLLARSVAAVVDQDIYAGNCGSDGRGNSASAWSPMKIWI